MKNILINCDFCKKPFLIKNKIFNNGKRKNRKHYCSKECQINSQKTGKNVKCNNCGKEIYRTKAQLRDDNIYYCSVECTHKKINHSHKHSIETKNKIGTSVKNKLQISEKYNLYKEKQKSKKVEKKCPICQKKFIVNACSISRIYCSRLCYFKDKDGLFRKKHGGGKREHSGRGKKGWYNGYYCDSSWELAYVIYNIEHNIKFERNKQGFEYWYLGNKHKFYPDFILEDGTYVEIKGYLNEKNKIKINSFQDCLIVLDKNGIKVYLDYVESKYGKDFTNLYENNPNKEMKNKCKICGKPCKKEYCSRKCSGKGVNRLKYGMLV